MQKTKIEWVKNPDGTQGYSSNPVKGYCPIACPYCYARGLYDRFGWDKTIRLDVDELLAIERHKKSAGIFLGSTFELFWDRLERFWLDSIFRTIKDCPQHRFYLLTKQPQNLIKFSPFPDNCWPGVTITESNTDAGSYLMDVEAKVKFISFEPLLRWANYSVEGTAKALKICGVNWVIIGAQTKPYKPPKLEWVEEIVRACDKAGVKVFLKDNLHPILSKQTATMFHRAYPDYCELRQEMP